MNPNWLTESNDSSSSLILSPRRFEAAAVAATLAPPTAPRPRSLRELMGIDREKPRPAQPRLGTLTSGRDPTSCSMALWAARRIRSCSSNWKKKTIFIFLCRVELFDKMEMQVRTPNFRIRITPTSPLPNIFASQAGHRLIPFPVYLSYFNSICKLFKEVAYSRKIQRDIF